MDWISFIGGYVLGGGMGALIVAIFTSGRDTEAEAEAAEMAALARRAYRADATIIRKEASE